MNAARCSPKVGMLLRANAWEYTFNVMLGSAWPMRRQVTTTSAPLAISNEA
jgi:hypothetical protein